MKKIINAMKGNVGLLVIVVALAVFPLYLIASQTAEAQASDCYTNFVFHWHIVNPVLACIEDRLDTGGGGEANTASNLGDGDGVFAQKVGVDLQFKSLENGSGITLSSDANEVTISSSVSGESTVCTNTGTGVGICNGGNIALNSLRAGAGMSIQNTIDDITISNTSQEQTVCNNVGTPSGTGLCYTASGDNIAIKSLRGITGISVATDGSFRVGITNTLPEITTCINQGSGSNLCGSGNVGIKSLIAGTGITITDTTDDWTIDNTVVDTDDLIGQLVVSVFQSVTKTNIGTAYVDAYVSAFDMENMAQIDCSLITDFRIVYMWDYVGSGTQQIRWVDVSDNANVLYETATFIIDQDGIDSGWFSSPAFCTGIISIELQGKSTTAGDDPQAKGYVVYAR